MASGIVNIVVIEPSCFLEDTKILCLKDDKEIYIPIQDLCMDKSKDILVKILAKNYTGTDLVIQDGYKKIDTIIHSKMYNSDLVHYKERLYKCTSNNYPEITEDLFITGCHSILVDTLNEEEYEKTIELLGNIYMTNQKYRLLSCIDKRSELVKDVEIYDIYHIALENDNIYSNYGIYANGLLVESCSKRMITKKKTEWADAIK